MARHQLIKGFTLEVVGMIDVHIWSQDSNLVTSSIP